MYSLEDIMNSKNIAVFGASRDREKPGSMLINLLRQSNFQGEIAGVNPQRGNVHGIPIYTSIDEVPFDVDLAVMIIPPAAVVGAVRDCARKNVKGIVITSEGFSESGEQGRLYQHELVKISKQNDTRIIGPNTLGLLNTQTGLTSSYFADVNSLSPGSIGFAAQSGVFVGAFMHYLSSLNGLGISKGIGLGNKIDINECDALDFLAEDDQTHIIGLYLEDIRNGRKFLRAAQNASSKKPVLLIKSGKTSAGSKAIASHTASMALNDVVLNGALKQAGVLRLEGLEELTAAFMGFSWMPLPKGNKIAIVTYSGAHSIMCIDLVSELGLTLTRFQPETRTRLSTVMKNEYKYQNPIDIYPDMLAHGFEKTLAVIFESMFQDDDVNGIIFISFAIESAVDMYRPLVKVIKDKGNKPVFVSLLGKRAEVQATGNFFQDQNIPFFSFPESGIRTFALMWQYQQFQMYRHRPTIFPSN